jgi:hypothetical protein
VTQPDVGHRGRRRRLFPGDRRVWTVAGGLGALLLLGVAIWMLVPRGYYTGTNSVRTRGIVTELKPPERLCVRGLQLPADTGRVQMEVVAGPAQLPEMRARIVASRTVSESRSPAGVPGPHAKVDFPIEPVRTGGRESVPGSICLETSLPVSFGGMAGVQSDDVLPTLDGKPQEVRVAVWFLPRGGAKRAPIAMLPDVLSRAALFRPGIVGPWTYWVLLFLLLPALIYWALRLLATAAEPGRSVRRLAASLFAIAFLSAAAWAVITPSFNAPDESEHFAYAQYVAETGRGVDSTPSKRAPYSSEENAALEGLRLFSSTEAGDGKPPWLHADKRRWERRAANGPLAQDDGGGFAAATNAHSPAYYLLLAPAYVATRGQSIFSQLFAMRLISALLGGVVAVCAFLVVRELVPRRPVAAVGAALIVLFQPMFGFMSGSVNNDMGVNAGAAVLLYLLVRGLRRGLTPLLGGAIGAMLVITPLLKGTGLALFPAALVALGFMLWRNHSRGDLPAFAAVAGAFLAFTIGWKLLAPSFERSTLTTPGGGTEGVGARNDIGAFLSYLWQVFLPRLPFMSDHFAPRWPAFNIYVERGWGAFGWYAVFFPLWVYVTVAATMIGTAVMGCLALLRNRAAARDLAPVVVLFVLAVAGVIGGVHAFYYAPGLRTTLPEFGRYAFPVITALAAASIGSLFLLPRRLLVPAVTALVVLVMGLSYAARFLTLFGFYS